jgi:hypothetical protein
MWCYAHSAADLVSQKFKTQVSAFDLATTYLLENENSLRLSKNPEIQNYLKKDKYFFKRLKRWRNDEPESYLPERILTEKGLYYLGGMDQDAILLSHQKGFCAEENLPGGPENLENYLNEISDYAKSVCGGSIESCHWQSPTKIGEIKNPKSQALAKIFKNWVNKKCHDRLIPKKSITVKVVSYADDLSHFHDRLEKNQISKRQVQAALKNFIDQTLNSGKIVAVGYDLLDIAPLDFAVGPDATEKQVDHSSVIAARKSINGECRYFLRTHMGANCQYRNSVNGLCESREGGVWVSLRDLPSLYSALALN